MPEDPSKDRGRFQGKELRSSPEEALTFFFFGGSVLSQETSETNETATRSLRTKPKDVFI
jgi:hypothetical protein